MDFHSISILIVCCIINCLSCQFSRRMFWLLGIRFPSRPFIGIFSNKQQACQLFFLPYQHLLIGFQRSLMRLLLFQLLSHAGLCKPMDCSPPGSSAHGISRQEYWSGLPFPSRGDLLDPGVELASPAWQADSLSLSHIGSPMNEVLQLYLPAFIPQPYYFYIIACILFFCWYVYETLLLLKME